jgi:mRNA-degrading endonuclease toxin of MazEF toxin-antitoxin module
MRRGSVRWVHIDKRRPGIVMSPETLNLYANDVIVVPCSSAHASVRWHVELKKGEAGLSVASIAKCEAVTTLPKDLVEDEELGVVSPARLQEIEKALISALGIQD